MVTPMRQLWGLKMPEVYSCQAASKHRVKDTLWSTCVRFSMMACNSVQLKFKELMNPGIVHVTNGHAWRCYWMPFVSICLAMLAPWNDAEIIATCSFRGLARYVEHI